MTGHLETGEPDGSTGARRPARSLVYRLLEDYCGPAGLRLHAADPYGHGGMVEAPDGRRWFFKGTRFDLNGYGACEFANDKAYTAAFLKDCGLAVPATLFAASADLAGRRSPPAHVMDFADSAGFPLFVKPNTGKEGEGVFRVDTFHGLQAALHQLAGRHDTLVLQEEVRGRELRLLILDGALLCAVERTPPMVTGDGDSSLAELIDAYPAVDPSDDRIDFELATRGMTLTSVPEPGQTVRLLPVANLSAGGTAKFVTGSVEPDIVDIARRAVDCLALRYAGVDLILPDDPDGPAAIVLEVNAAPGLTNLHRLSSDHARTVEDVYRRIFGALFSEEDP